MNTETIDVFTSKEYRLLCWLRKKQMKTSDGMCIVFSQAELAKQYGISLGTINNWINSLKKAGCIKPYKKKSGYIITPFGEYVVAHINEINKYNGGKKNAK